MGALIPIEQLERIRRENWQGEDGATRLAQELYCLLGADLPIVSSSPLTLNQTDPTVPVLTVNPSADPNAVPATNVSGGGGGGVDPTNITFSPAAAPGSLPSTLPMVLYGIVQGKIGGQVYSVRCWMKSTSSTPMGTYPVTCGQIDPTDVLPNLTEILVWVALRKQGTQTVVDEMRMIAPLFLVSP